LNAFDLDVFVNQLIQREGYERFGGKKKLGSLKGRKSSKV
jgi:hypothetical protein